MWVARWACDRAGLLCVCAVNSEIAQVWVKAAHVARAVMLREGRRGRLVDALTVADSSVDGTVQLVPGIKKLPR